MTLSHPVLYSFRRCPYAIRTRMALRYCQVAIELREVKLSQKPAEMLVLSPKGTVPVLALPDGTVLDESLEIIKWALSQQDTDNWRLAGLKHLSDKTFELIAENDTIFKRNLDRYKYADRHPDQPAIYYRRLGEAFISTLDQQLSKSQFLASDQMSIADVAILPFVRQFAHVDQDWFYGSSYLNVIDWMRKLLDTDLFQSIMNKQDPWHAGSEAVVM